MLYQSRRENVLAARLAVFAQLEIANNMLHLLGLINVILLSLRVPVVEQVLLVEMADKGKGYAIHVTPLTYKKHFTINV